MRGNRLSEHFSWSEFTKSDKAKEHHVINEIADWDVRDNIIALTDNVLEPARCAIGEPMFINSGFRCPELNKLVGGEDDSQHQYGEAADVTCSDLRRLAETIIKLRLPFDQMGIANNYLHISHKRDGENRGEIFYYANYRGKRDL